MKGSDLSARLGHRRVIFGHLTTHAVVLPPLADLTAEDVRVSSDAEYLSDTKHHRGLYVDRRGRVWVLSGHHVLSVAVLDDDAERTSAQQHTLELLGELAQDETIPDDDPILDEAPAKKTAAKTRKRQS